MTALYSCVQLISQHHRLTTFYKKNSDNIFELEDSYNEFQSAFFLHIMKMPDSDINEVVVALEVFRKKYQGALAKINPQGQREISDRFFSATLDIQHELAQTEEAVIGLSRTKSRDEALQLMPPLESVEKKIDELWGILYGETAAQKISDSITRREKMLYWSIIAVGLSALILVLLSTDRLRRLAILNERRKEDFRLLSERLAAMETTYDGIGIVNEKGDLIYMNRALKNLHGIPPERETEFIGRSWTNLYTDRGRAEVENSVMPVLREQGHWRGESTILRLDGSKVVAEMSLTRLEHGGFIGTARDITEEKKSELERENLQAQFYQAQKMEAIGRLAGGIAHDFNNILAAINGYAGFLQEDLAKDSPQYDFARKIMQAGQQARDLVDQILAFSRRSDSNTSYVDLAECVRESVSMFEASFPKTIVLDVDIRQERVPVQANAVQMTQMIMNLGVNAKDAMRGDRGALKISVRIVEPAIYADTGILADDLPNPEESPILRLEDMGPERTLLFMGVLARTRRYVNLKIEDSGSGMSRAVMEHIFEPFFTTKPIDEGTGLGLSMVHGVVAGHHGAMIVDSTVGRGTIFDIFIPLAEVNDQSQAGAAGPVELLDKARILLVEDQEEVLDVMLNMLQRLGCNVTACTGALQALERLREDENDFDLVISDYNMPHMTGLDLAFQAHQDFPDLPFIIVTGYSEQQIQALMQDNPAIKMILRKPISREALASAIRATVRAARKAA